MTLVPDDARRTPTRSSSDMPRTPGRSCCVIFRQGRCSHVMHSNPICRSRGGPSLAAICCRSGGSSPPTCSKRLAACIHNCEFCVVPAAWGRKPYQKPVEDVVADIRQHGARKLIFVDLNLIADRAYAERLFDGADSRCRCSGTACRRFSLPRICRCCSSRRGAAAAACCSGSSRFEPTTCVGRARASTSPTRYTEVVSVLHAHGIAVYGCFVFGMDHDTPDIFLETARLCRRRADRSAAFRRRHTLSRDRALSSGSSEKGAS